jgi:hypothetical protein
MSQASALFKRTQAEPAVTATGVTAEFDTQDVVYAALDINVQTINAGNITFTLQRQGTDGVWYNGPATAAIAAAGQASIDISPGAARVASQTDHFVFTGRARISYVLAGGANSATWSASLMGRTAN